MSLIKNNKVDQISLDLGGNQSKNTKKQNPEFQINENATLPMYLGREISKSWVWTHATLFFFNLVSPVPNFTATSCQTTFSERPSELDMITSLHVLVSIKFKSLSASWCAMNYFSPYKYFFPETKRRKPLVDLLPVPWKVLRRTIFHSSTSSKPLYLKRVIPRTFLSHSIGEMRFLPKQHLSMNHYKSQVDASSVTTILIWSSLGLTVIFRTYHHKLCFLPLTH